MPILWGVTRAVYRIDQLAAQVLLLIRLILRRYEDVLHNIGVEVNLCDVNAMLPLRITSFADGTCSLMFMVTSCAIMAYDAKSHGPRTAFLADAVLCAKSPMRMYSSTTALVFEPRSSFPSGLWSAALGGRGPVKLGTALQDVRSCRRLAESWRAGAPRTLSLFWARLRTIHSHADEG